MSSAIYVPMSQKAVFKVDEECDESTNGLWNGVDVQVAAKTDRTVDQNEDNHVYIHLAEEEKDMPDSEHIKKHGFLMCLIAAFSLIAIGTVGFFCIIFLGKTHTLDSVGTSIVIDAGTSSTKLSFFNWDGEKISGTALIKNIAYHKCGVFTSITNYLNHPKDVGPQLLGPCLEQLLALVPAENEQTHKSHPPRVILGATSSTRVAMQNDSTKVNTLFDHIYDYIKAQPRNYIIKREWISVLSGYEEAVCAWIAVNAMNWKEMHKRTETFGSLDMGGGSAQISFELNQTGSSELEIAPNDVDNFSLFNQSFSVYGHSYEGFGILSMQQKFFSMLAMQSTGGIIETACLLQGSPPISKLGRSLDPDLPSDNLYTFGSSSKNTTCSEEMDLIFSSSTNNRAECPYQFTFNDVCQPHIPKQTNFYVKYLHLYE